MDFDPPLATAVLAGAVEGGASERAWRREDLQRRGSFGDLSDAESDCSQASRVSLKRTWSESSQGRTESSGSLAAASEPGLGRAGTWPLQVDDDEDMWRARSGGGASAAEWMSLDPLLWPRSDGLPASGAESSPFEGILGAPHVPVNLPGVVDDVGRGPRVREGCARVRACARVLGDIRH
ncbi:hypothetical protein EMIHUDRAFT_215542 [Emiliania huxleyi CCMP1516]|uniref:Uncharacterized protein n=2 Tax=Emiliania huxleyi TaxID=2903 RepID=A0A0D3IHJ7_EMIH1|nr:hypothetical protein EMIHUDRAFT_215542 [Emiliania huxleyi CCMP1516]EOD10732.1 hypothetical protein EMIHUDRAFT_215542 [Emiliania huxleyi CCMP1516]|eukprot:XP_005763161.1 hypothetical protein EMIHUDRAFT_215542 [Emiliania huxleyi CCMP1516]